MFKYNCCHWLFVAWATKAVDRSHDGVWCSVLPGSASTMHYGDAARKTTRQIGGLIMWRNPEKNLQLAYRIGFFFLFSGGHLLYIWKKSIKLVKLHDNKLRQAIRYLNMFDIWYLIWFTSQELKSLFSLLYQLKPLWEIYCVSSSTLQQWQGFFFLIPCLVSLLG